MVNIIIYIVLSSGIAGLFFAIKIMSRKLKKQKIEIMQKDLQLEKAAQNIKVLTDYQRARDEIRKNHNDLVKEIESVKEGDDEKIDDILRRIIDINNKRVQNSSSGSN